MNQNLEKVVALATSEDWDIANRAWFRYRDILVCCAIKNRTSLEAAVGVYAALSPNNDYVGNIRDAGKMLAAKSVGAPIESFTSSTYHANKRKAWAIAGGAHPLEIIKAPKTRNFYLNTVNPFDPHPVTVDGHIFNAWRGKRLPLNSDKLRVDNSNYDEVAGQIREIATERNTRANVIQGVIWYTWKRIHGILYTKQTDFWARDYHAAGLGWKFESPRTA